MRLAVVGLGRVGYDFGLDKNRPQPASHFHCYAELPSEEISVCDSDTKKLTTAKKQIEQTLPLQQKTINYFDSLKEMMDYSHPHVVSVCVPTPLHKGVVQEVVKRGPRLRAIFLEKPIASNVQDAEDIIGICNSNGIKLTVNYTRRWDPTYRSLFTDPYNHAIGIHPGPTVRTGTHMIDLFNMYLGKPRRVRAFRADHNYLTNNTVISEDTKRCDWSLSGTIDYDCKQAVLLAGPCYEKNVLFELDLMHPNYRVRVTDNGRTVDKYTNTTSLFYDGLKEFKLNHTYFPTSEATPLYNAIEEVAFCPIQNSCCGEDALEALKVALGLHYSWNCFGKEINLDDVPKDYEVTTY